MSYAKDWDNGTYDYVIEFRLKSALDICNLKNKNDYNRVLPFAEKVGLSKKNLNEMAEYDWYQFADDYKTKLVSAIKDAGFDGFFNWEYPPMSYSYYKDRSKAAPSFGIFESENLELVRVWDKDDFTSNSNFQRQHNAEIESLRKMVFDTMVDVDWDITADADYELNKDSFSDSGKFTVSQSDIYNYYKTLSKKELNALWKLRQLYIDMDKYTYKFNFDGKDLDKADDCINDAIYDESVKPAESILSNLDNLEVYLKSKAEELSSSRK